MTLFPNFRCHFPLLEELFKIHTCNFRSNLSKSKPSFPIALSYQDPSWWLSPVESAFSMSLLFFSLQLPLSLCFCSPHQFIHTFTHAPTHLFNNSLWGPNMTGLCLCLSSTPWAWLSALSLKCPQLFCLSFKSQPLCIFSYSFTHVWFFFFFFYFLKSLEHFPISFITTWENSYLSHLLTVWLWASYIPKWSLSFSSKIGVSNTP